MLGIHKFISTPWLTLYLVGSTNRVRPSKLPCLADFLAFIDLEAKERDHFLEMIALKSPVH